MNKQTIINNCKKLLIAYKNGKLGQTIMPEDTNPGLDKMSKEFCISYFTLPMSLNYQRDSYKLWGSALKTFNDPKTNFVFDVNKISKKSETEIRDALLKYKLALQPNKHINTWTVISKTIYNNFGSFENFIKSTNNDFLILKQIVQKDYKKGFPYLSGPKIFNYWAFTLTTYCGIKLKNRDKIDIAPDTHVTQCSVKLGVISEQEAKSLSKEEISNRWRNVLKGSNIDPIDMHRTLWFWSRNGFIYKLDEY
jgi:hypothetical protein